MSCTSSKEPQNLQNAENIIGSDPDSALVILKENSKSMKDYPKKFRMKYYLLYAEAMNSSYCLMDTIHFMPEVLNYYTENGSNDEVAKSNYLMGCVYRDRGNSLKALQYYQEATKYAQKHDYLLASRIYGQMASIYMEQRYPEMEIKSWKAGRHYALLAKDTLMAIQCLERYGDAYKLQGKEDSANLYFEMAYNEYIKNGYKENAAGCLIYRVDSYLKSGLLEKAGNALNVYRKESGLFLPNGEIRQGCEIYYYYIGKYYTLKGDYKAASHYYRKLLGYKNDIQNVENAYRGLMYMFSLMGQADSTVKYAGLYAAADDSANVLRSSTDIIRMQSLYNYSESQKLAVSKAKESMNLWITLFVSLVFFIIFMSIFSYLLKKHRKESLRAKKEYENAIEQLDKAEKELDSVQRNRDLFEKQKKEEISKLQDYISAYRDNFKPEKWNKEQNIRETSIVGHIQGLAIQGKRLPESEWNDLEDTIKKLMKPFYNNLNKIGSGLSDQEYKVCVLTRLNFSPTDIANLLGISQQRVTNIRSNLNNELFHQKGTQHFSSNIARI